MLTNSSGLFGIPNFGP